MPVTRSNQKSPTGNSISNLTGKSQSQSRVKVDASQTQSKFTPNNAKMTMNALSNQIAELRKELTNQQQSSKIAADSLTSQFEEKYKQLVENIQSLQATIETIKSQMNDALQPKLSEPSLDETIKCTIKDDDLTQIEYACKHQYECMNNKISEIECNNKMNEDAIEDLLNAIDLQFTRINENSCRKTKRHNQTQKVNNIGAKHSGCINKMLPIINEMLDVEYDKFNSRCDVLTERVDQLAKSYEIINGHFNFTMKNAAGSRELDQLVTEQELISIKRSIKRIDKQIENNRLAHEKMQTKISNTNFELDTHLLKCSTPSTNAINNVDEKHKTVQTIGAEKPNFVASNRYASRRFVGNYDKLDFTRQFTVRITDSSIYNPDLAVKEIRRLIESILGRNIVSEMKIIDQRSNDAVINRIDLAILLEIPLGYDYIDGFRFPANWDFSTHFDSIADTRHDTNNSKQKQVV